MEKECQERLKEITLKFKTCSKAIAAIGKRMKEKVNKAYKKLRYNVFKGVASKN